MKNIDFNKHIYEGWTVGDFIQELQPQLDLIQSGASWYAPMTNKKDLKKWIVDNQPYYKKAIKEVLEYFYNRYNVTK